MMECTSYNSAMYHVTNAKVQWNGLGCGQVECVRKLLKTFAKETSKPPPPMMCGESYGALPTMTTLSAWSAASTLVSKCTGEVASHAGLQRCARHVTRCHLTVDSRGLQCG
jgi:hypothetical protein